jgi:AcrR family transcriptional regulator
MKSTRTTARRTRRAYESPLRAAQAQQTRRAVIDSATACFVDRGYGATSIDAIAEAARVGRATVFNAVGGKRALLKAAYDVAIVGDDEPVALPDRPWAAHVREAANPRELLRRYAAMVTQIDIRVAPIYEALRGAAGSDAEIRELWDEIQAERRQGGHNVVAMVRAKQPTRQRSGRFDDDALGDVVFMLIDPGVYFSLVHRCGWTSEQFEHWLAATLQQQLLQGR